MRAAEAPAQVAPACAIAQHRQADHLRRSLFLLNHSVLQAVHQAGRAFLVHRLLCHCRSAPIQALAAAVLSRAVLHHRCFRPAAALPIPQFHQAPQATAPLKVLCLVVHQVAVAQQNPHQAVLRAAASPVSSQFLHLLAVCLQATTAAAKVAHLLRQDSSQLAPLPAQYRHHF